jgi:hypothetical protein
VRELIEHKTYPEELTPEGLQRHFDQARAYGAPIKRIAVLPEKYDRPDIRIVAERNGFELKFVIDMPPGRGYIGWDPDASK